MVIIYGRVVQIKRGARSARKLRRKKYDLVVAENRLNDLSSLTLMLSTITMECGQGHTTIQSADSKASIIHGVPILSSWLLTLDLDLENRSMSLTLY